MFDTNRHDLTQNEWYQTKHERETWSEKVYFSKAEVGICTPIQIYRFTCLSD